MRGLVCGMSLWLCVISFLVWSLVIIPKNMTRLLGGESGNQDGEQGELRLTDTGQTKGSLGNLQHCTELAVSQPVGQL